MTPFQYRINQCVRFRYHERTRASAPGNYKILGYRPIEDVEPRYRIKSELEQHERIARECELSKAE
jgi:hypothetical protein